MKDVFKSWIFWAVVACLIIAAVVLYFTYPSFCYAVSGALIGGLAGFIAGYYVRDKKQ